MMFAHVRYVEDNIKAIVPATLIRHFNPKTVVDYDKGRHYEAYWRTATGDQEGYYAAFILQLAGKTFVNKCSRERARGFVTATGNERSCRSNYGLSDSQLHGLCCGRLLQEGSVSQERIML